VRYRQLGRTGLKISELVLGAARFGEIDHETANRIIGTALDLGISTFDTADTYNNGASEWQLGPIIRPHRDRIVLCSKVGLRVGDTEADLTRPMDHAERWRRGIAPTDSGLSRKHIMSALKDSLSRLGTDYIDLYQVHRFDPETPIEETVSALDDLVHAGLVRYIGCSGFAAAQLAQALDISDEQHLSRFASVQATYSLVSRNVEAELAPLCVERGVGILAFGVVAGGMLTGRYLDQANEPGPETRLGSRQVFKRIYWTDQNFATVSRLRAVAEKTGRSPSELAAGWVAAQPGVGGVLLGISKPEQLTDVANVFENPLSDEELTLAASVTQG
jgi:1-deoxyxylulose-5-phosphate synthase